MKRFVTRMKKWEVMVSLIGSMACTIIKYAVVIKEGWHALVK